MILLFCNFICNIEGLIVYIIYDLSFVWLIIVVDKLINIMIGNVYMSEYVLSDSIL